MMIYLFIVCLFAGGGADCKDIWITFSSKERKKQFLEVDIPKVHQ